MSQEAILRSGTIQVLKVLLEGVIFVEHGACNRGSDGRRLHTEAFEM